MIVHGEHLLVRPLLILYDDNSDGRTQCTKPAKSPVYKVGMGAVLVEMHRLADSLPFCSPFMIIDADYAPLDPMLCALVIDFVRFLLLCSTLYSSFACTLNAISLPNSP